MAMSVVWSQHIKLLLFWRQKKKKRMKKVTAWENFTYMHIYLYKYLSHKIQELWCYPQKLSEVASPIKQLIKN